ncbi:SH3 domain-containing protein [Streptococcus castoreus]|uniref:SH3 domain-containing protein n=1 Tax=Streptococcus castoreus TaxID=254786 RepID=UPI0003FAFCD0|nr:SH3 domain-containing protein [Streptococcus castoreus]
MKKIHQFLVSGAILLSVSGAAFSTTAVINTNQAGIVHAAVLGDNYPTKWKSGTGIDSWNMYLRQCTSFVAFRLSSVNAFQLPKGYGNACTWGHMAKKQGYSVNKTPKVGAVAWFDIDAYQSNPIYGHVAWVAEVRGDNVIIEEYNYNAGQGPEKYHKRQIHKNQASGYIHFKDLSTHSENQQPQQNQAAETNLSQSGTYYFSNRAPIKAQANLASPDLAYYSSGQSVHYDKTLTADGYEWLSYLSFAGNRRYIPIKKLAQPTSLPLTKQETKSLINVGDTVTFPGVFRVDQIIHNMIASNELAGGDPTPLNWIDPTPLNETDLKGQVAGDQIFQIGESFVIPGHYKVLKIDPSSNGIYVKIGSHGTWLNADKANKV